MALKKEDPGYVPGVSVGLIFCQETGKMVFIKNTTHDDPLTKLIGGTIESFETAREALIREILEETGLVIDPEDIYFLFEHENKRRGHSFWVFTCTVSNLNNLRKEPKQDGDARLKAFAITPEEASDMFKNRGFAPFHSDMFDMGFQMVTMELEAG